MAGAAIGAAAESGAAAPTCATHFAGASDDEYWKLRWKQGWERAREAESRGSALEEALGRAQEEGAGRRDARGRREAAYHAGMGRRARKPKAYLIESMANFTSLAKHLEIHDHS